MAEIVLAAGRTEGQYWRDLWRYRELFYVLAWRDIAVRYKQTAIGVLWALLQPLVSTVLLTVVFQYFAGMKATGTTPYALMVFAGNMPWQFFTSSLSGASQSVMSNTNLISKVYFPRLIIPAGAVVTALVDLGISFILLFAMMAWYHCWPTWHMLFLPFCIAFAFAAALGPGLLFTALTVKYRDFRFITPFIVQIGALISPVGYPIARVHASLAHQHLPFNIDSSVLFRLYCLNPMVSVIEGFRWCVSGDSFDLDPVSCGLSVLMTTLLVFLGIWFFRRTERSFADVI